MLQAGRSFRVSISGEVIEFFNFLDPSSRTIALEWAQPLIEMSTNNLPLSKALPTRVADNLTTIFEPIVWKIWDPRRLTTL
jgi:hypothetical protein